MYINFDAVYQGHSKFARETSKTQTALIRPWQTRTHCCGHIVAHDVSWAQTGKHLLRTQNVSEQHQTNFVSATNVARVGKRENICVGNNVSSFARAL